MGNRLRYGRRFGGMRSAATGIPSFRSAIEAELRKLERGGAPVVKVFTEQEKRALELELNAARTQKE
jgi:hypothetical protein